MEMNEQKHSQAAILGLQHLLAMYAGSILVPIMIASALNYSAEQLTYLISTDIFMCGVATFLQLQLREHFALWCRTSSCSWLCLPICCTVINHRS